MSETFCILNEFFSPFHHIAHTGLVKKKIDDYQPIIEERRTTLLRNVWQKATEKPVSLTHVIEHYTMTTILTIAFGGLCSFEAGDTRLHEAFQLTERIAALLGPGEQIREFFPILQYILPSKRANFIDARAKMVSFYGGLLEEYKKIMGSPADTQDCFFKKVLAKGELTDLQVISFGSLFVGAGIFYRAMKGVCGSIVDIYLKARKQRLRRSSG